MLPIISAADLPALFINNTPLLDVRSPLEFSRGAFPTATNLPLLNNSERATVGTVYKTAGQQAAITQGNALVSGVVKSQRMQVWQDYIAQHPDAVLYCYRGGLRSATVQQWLAAIDIEIPRIAGGYKRMRRELLHTLEQIATDMDLLIVAGKTGSGKTHLINALQHSLDLEGLANHRGSAFGPRAQGQPTQIDFENALAIALLQQADGQARRLFLEDESRAIGSLSLPQTLYGKMLAAPIALLEEPIAQRVDTILRDYILSNYEEFKAADPANYPQLFADYLLGSLDKIRRRLGDANYHALRASMESALPLTQIEPGAHREWIMLLLQQYYDPMYAYQLQKKTARIVFRGSRAELLHWAAKQDVAQQLENA